MSTDHPFDVTRPDYDATIRVGARVRDLTTGDLGWVIESRGRCHWTCDEWASQWRPRSAYVLFDKSCPPRDPRGHETEFLSAGDWTGSYVAPEHLHRVPLAWWRPRNAILPVTLRLERECFQPFVIRPSRSVWWAMNREDQGFASLGCCYLSWAEAAIGCGAEVYATGRDAHSWFVRARAATEVSRVD